MMCVLYPPFENCSYVFSLNEELKLSASSDLWNIIGMLQICETAYLSINYNLLKRNNIWNTVKCIETNAIRGWAHQEQRKYIAVFFSLPPVVRENFWIKFSISRKFLDPLNIKFRCLRMSSSAYNSKLRKYSKKFEA